jgi:hypothetical protein
MEFRKRSRSNPLNDDDDINDLISVKDNTRKNVCYNIAVWIFKVVTCQCCSYRKKRELKAADNLKRAAYISQV